MHRKGRTGYGGNGFLDWGIWEELWRAHGVSPPPEGWGGVGVGGQSASKGQEVRNNVFGADVVSVQMDGDWGQCHPDSRWHYFALCGQAGALSSPRQGQDPFPSCYEGGLRLMEAGACSRLEGAGPGWSAVWLSPQHSASICRELGLLRPHRASRGHGGSGNGTAAGLHSEKSHDHRRAFTKTRRATRFTRARNSMWWLVWKGHKG